MSQISEPLENAEYKESVESDLCITANDSNSGDGRCEPLGWDEVPPGWLLELATGAEEARGHRALVAALVVLLLEAGFSSDGTPRNLTGSFDARVMRRAAAVHLRRDNVTNYNARFHLGDWENVLDLVAFPLGDFLVVDLCLTDCLEVVPRVFRVGDYVTEVGPPPRFTGLRSLSAEFKTVAAHIRDRVVCSRESIPTGILALPYEILFLVSRCLDLKSFFRFCSTCSLLYSNLFEDEKIWKRLTLSRDPSPKLHESLTWKDHLRFLHPINRRPSFRAFPASEYGYDFVGSYYEFD